MKMSSFTFKSADVTSAANKIRSNLANIENDIKGIRTENQRIQSAWSGIDSNNYTRKVEESTVKIQRLVTSLYDLASLLDRSASAIEYQQQKIAAESINL